jgi:cyanophycinase-like exopeptidase
MLPSRDKKGFLSGIAVWAMLFASGACAASAAHNYRDRNFDYFVSGDPARPRAAHTEFGLALMGGGGSVDAAFEFIARHAGGGHIVILRAVSDDSHDPDDGNYGASFVGKWGPVTSAETIVFHNREAAGDARVLAALEGADGIFLAGGDQANYVRYWKGTPVQELLDAHVRANRPIGGSSAGLAVLGHYSYTAFDGGSMESKVALADPFDDGVTLESDFLHYRWLEDVITDTHFSARSRLGRLIAFVARLNGDDAAGRANPTRIYGVGIDEHTALLVDASGMARLAPGSAGSAWFVMPTQRSLVLVKGKPLSVEGIRLSRLDAAGTFDFAERKIEHAAAESIISLKNGKLTAPSIASPILLREKAPADES